MDDDTFQKEILERLDKITTLLSHFCQASPASLRESLTETFRRTKESIPTDTPPSERYLIKDEMQDNYRLAMQKWKEEKKPAEEPILLDDPICHN